MLPDLPFEVREQVLDCCSIDDAKSLSLTSSEYNAALKPYLFRVINVPQDHIKDDKQLVRRLESMDEILVLRIHTDTYSISLDVYESVSNMSQLQELRLSRSPVSLTSKTVFDDMGISLLCSGLSRLTVLELRNSRITDKACSQLPSLMRLQKLVLEGCRKLDDGSMRHITKLTQLKVLHICPHICDRSELTEAALNPITDLVELVELKLDNLKIGNSAFQKVCQLRKLARLTVSYCYNITEAGFSMIENLVGLEKLKLERCKVTDSVFGKIFLLTNLETLELTNFLNISDSGFSNLNSMILEELILERFLIGDVSFRKICQLRLLRILDINNSRSITDDGFSSISNLKSLEKLNLMRCSIGDRGFRQVCELQNLKVLNISYCRYVTDIGFCYIEKLVNLDELRLGSCHKLSGKEIKECWYNSNLSEYYDDDVGCVDLSNNYDDE